MARIFTITEGVENMGAIKTGGQGSIYKARRHGEIITAIKILPTPVFSESEADKNYIAFQNEVQKLKTVNERPNPNVVKFLDSGITDSGNFPFIEMEFIEGPDLEELLKPPHDPLFGIKEVVKVAEHLSCALAHCHEADVRHGDIKSNNVKFNINTRNYILLDFGLAAMSEEHRRTSIRHAGAVEFMAPEQNEGLMLFETDVYSFGVILFELLAATVPFRLNDKSETARNKVMVAHLEMPPPDLLTLRRGAMPPTWSDEKRELEMQVPGWLTTLVYKCLQKKPGDRFSNGRQLNNYISQQITGKETPVLSNEGSTPLQQEILRLSNENEQLRQQLHQRSLIPGSPQKAGKSNVPGVPGIDKSMASYVRTRLMNTRRSLFFVLLVFVLAAVTWYLSTAAKKNEPPVVTKPASAAVDAATPAVAPAIKSQLQDARRFLNEGKVVEAFTIYSSLSKQEIPEAMYLYGKLALQNRNGNLNCLEAYDLLKKAGDKGYTPAKRTLGFLYSFADDEEALKKANLYERCKFKKNVAKGSVLLMEAMLSGDTTAARLLDQLQLKQ